MTISGPSGELRYGYFVAARIGKWKKAGGRVTAPLLASNSVYVSRRPLDLVLVLGTRRWIWRGVEAQLVGSRAVIMVTGDRPEVI